MIGKLKRKKSEVSEKQGRQGRKAFKAIETLLDTTRDVAKKAAKPVLGGLLVVGTAATISSCGPKKEYKTINNYYSNETTEYSLDITAPTQYGNEATQEEEKKEEKFESAYARDTLSAGDVLNVSDLAVKFTGTSEEGTAFNYIIGTPGEIAINRAEAYAEVNEGEDYELSLEGNKGVYIHAIEGIVEVVQQGRTKLSITVTEDSNSGRISMGEELPVDGYSVQITDITADNQVIMRIQGNQVERYAMAASHSTTYVSLASDKVMKILVGDVEKGYTLQSSWADIDATLYTAKETPFLYKDDTYPLNETYSVVIRGFTTDGNAVYSIVTTEGTVKTVDKEDYTYDTTILDGKEWDIATEYTTIPKKEVTGVKTFVRVFHEDKANIGAIKPGETLDTPNYYIELVDVKNDDGYYASVNIYSKETGKRVGYATVYRGIPVEMAVDPKNSKKLFIYVSQLSSGYQTISKWARFFVEEVDESN